MFEFAIGLLIGWGIVWILKKIDERENMLSVSEVTYCEDCIYREVASEKTYCAKWKVHSGSIVCCSSGKKKESKC